MKHRFSIITFILCSFYFQNIFSQVNPSFDIFKADVYRMPYVDVKKGYNKKNVEDYKLLGNIEWNELNIPQRHYKDLLPGINKETLVCMIFKSSMTIPQDGCYTFSLNSDDGSRLWISDDLIIDNDGEHGMREKTDTIILEKGTYPVKVWYYQAYPDKCGIVLKANYTEKCNATKTVSKPENNITATRPTIPQEPIILQGQFLFDSNKSQLKEEILSTLDALCKQVKESLPKKITIIGHTDNLGSRNHNLKLSDERATTIAQYLMQKLNLPDIQYSIRGMGEEFPISSNETESGRAENRRVEIILE